VSHTGSEPGIPHAPASYQIPACLSNLYLRHTGTQPAVPPELRHTRSQPSRLTSFKVLLHAPVLNPFSLFQKKKKKNQNEEEEEEKGCSFGSKCPMGSLGKMKKKKIKIKRGQVTHIILAHSWLILFWPIVGPIFLSFLWPIVGPFYFGI